MHATLLSPSECFPALSPSRHPLKKKKTMRFCSLYHAFFLFFFWLMKLRDRLWTAECRFSIQTNNGADSVSVNGDQACLDEGFGGRRRALGLPLSLLICHSFFKQSAHLLRQTGGKDASSACCQNVIWAPDSAFPYQGHVWRLLHCVDLQKKKGKKHSHSLCHFTVLPFFQYFLCFTIHRLSLVVSSPSCFFPHFWSLLICLPREQTLYSSVILTSCFCFSSFCLALPHLSLHPLTYCGAFLMKPLKTDCFHTGDRRHKQQQSPHCCSVTPGFWPLNPAQWSRTNAFESSDAPPLDPPHLPPPPKVLLLAPLYRRECFSTTGEDSSPAAHMLSYMKGFSMDSSCCSPQDRLTEQRHGESSEMHATEVYVKFKPRSEKFKPNMTPNMSQQMLNKENIHDTHCGTYES